MHPWSQKKKAVELFDSGLYKHWLKQTDTQAEQVTQQGATKTG